MLQPETFDSINPQQGATAVEAKEGVTAELVVQEAIPAASDKPAAVPELATPPDSSPKGKCACPDIGTIWFVLTFLVVCVVAALSNVGVLYVMIGWRSMIALAGYLIMQVGLWHAENKWDEEGSAAYIAAAGEEVLKAAGIDVNEADPEELEKVEFGDVTIPEDKMKEAFPVPWGFLVGWWVWGISYIFPISGGGASDIDPTAYGIVACGVCFIISFIASVPMADAVMNRNDKKKKILSLCFLLGWIVLGIMSGLDVTKQLDNENNNYDTGVSWSLCMLGPFTVILSQKILFESRKMGTLWEASGKPNFHPIVYNMGGPLFVWGWFFFWVGVSARPGPFFAADIYISMGAPYWVPLFLNWRTLLSFLGGCAMVPVVRFLDYSHDEDGPWLGENDETPKAVFGKWWLGTDGTYFGVFLESPWPFVLAWTTFGFSSFLTWDNEFDVGWQAILIMVNCVAQGVDAGILIQANLYAGNKPGKTKFSLPFVILFVLLAVNIGSHWEWRALTLSFPGMVLIVLGQKTVFGARKRGDYTMETGKANPYPTVFVYGWGEVFFMMGWILICWGMAMP